MIEHLPIDQVQLGAETGLEHLLSATPLHKFLRHYLVACLVEGKSNTTVNIYRHTICTFIDYALWPATYRWKLLRFPRMVSGYTCYRCGSELRPGWIERRNNAIELGDQG